MTLYNSDYIRDFVDHDPSKILSLRNDEVSVFNRMNMLHKRKISLPTKLSGISEKENTSPQCMKEKLDELQEYHQVLEKQLVDIFTNISAVVENARRKSHSSLEDERPYNFLSNQFVTTKADIGQSKRRDSSTENMSRSGKTETNHSQQNGNHIKEKQWDEGKCLVVTRLFSQEQIGTENSSTKEDEPEEWIRTSFPSKEREGEFIETKIMNKRTEFEETGNENVLTLGLMDNGENYESKKKSSI